MRGNNRTDQFGDFGKVIIAYGSGDQFSLILSLVEREWRRTDRVDGERTMGFGASTRKGGCKKKEKK